MAEVLMRYRKATASLWLRQYRGEKIRHRLNKDVVVTGTGTGTSQRPKVTRPKTTPTEEPHLERQVLADGTVWNIVHQRHTLSRQPHPVRTDDVAANDVAISRHASTAPRPARPAPKAPEPMVRSRSPEELANDGFIVYRIRSSGSPVVRCSSLSEGSAVSSNKSNDDYIVYSSRESTADDADHATVNAVAPPSDQVHTSTWRCESARISYTDEHVSCVQLG